MSSSVAIARIRQARFGVVVLAVAAAALAGAACHTPAPGLTVTTVVSGLTKPWDVDFAGGNIVYTERPGRISAVVAGEKRLLAAPADVLVAGETGMMGLAVDPQFESNRYIYACFASKAVSAAGEVRLARWTVNSTFTGLTDRTDIITGAPINADGELGRHSGCRPRFGPDGYLWVGTGDAAVGTVPQDPRSLGGKVLRVNRDGSGAAGNPGGTLDPRVFSYGHRNVQGIAFRARDGLGVSTEHGPGRDDEINRLVPGNFGWDPVGPEGSYNENVPMTDKAKFPSAVSAIWSSGAPTVAPSGATFLEGSGWGNWNGALAVAELKRSAIFVHQFDSQAKQTDMWVTMGDQGRLRSTVSHPDGSLYVTTDNGGTADKILRVVPR
jgi:glucose/arabinose dehydrogenase